MSQRFLPYGRHVIDDQDIAAVTAVLRGDWLTTGPLVDAFEAALTKRLGGDAVVCSNGTTALHLAYDALRLGPGDTVIVPAVTFLATANAARYCGAEVLFADVDPDTGLMTAATLEAALAQAHAQGLRPKAAATVHLAGQVGDLGDQAAVARRHGLYLVEDGCHALGSDSPEGKVGSCAVSDLAVLSFHPVKTVATGEGGAVLARDPALAKRMRAKRSHGMLRDPAQLENNDLAFAADGTVNPWYYEMPELGWNYRLTDLQCALGISQLEKLDGFVARRAELVARYDAALARFGNRVRPMTRHAGRTTGWHLYVALIEFGTGPERATVMNRLKAAGIGTQVHYMPLYHHPYYRHRYGQSAMPGAEGWYRRCLSLPLFPALSDGDADRVIASLADALA